MADKAHEITDKIIRDTEKRLRREYQKAAKELEEKLNDYFRRFEIKDKKWQQWVKQGKKTEKEYKQWRTGQMAVGKRWKQMKDTIAEDLSHVNEIAGQICKEQQVDIYALNHAYGTYQTFTFEKYSFIGLYLYFKRRYHRKGRCDRQYQCTIKRNRFRSYSDCIHNGASG